MSVLEHMRPARGPGEWMRVSALEELGLMGAPPQERFDRVTRLAQLRFSVPMAQISLLDHERLFVTSPQTPGEPAFLPRAETFCDVTIRHPGVIVVPDATEDPRFAWKNAELGGSPVRFYAAVPLRFAGHAVGALCLVDTVARDLDDEERMALVGLGRWVEEEFVQSVHRRRYSPGFSRSSSGAS